MNDSSASPSPTSLGEDPPPPVIERRRRRPSSVWLIPTIAALLGLWLVYDFYTSKGPLAEVRFETAEGLVAQKTEVRCRSVKVGTVEAVRLSDDLAAVIVELRVDLAAKDLLREDSRFWVVRPRVGATGISGLETIVSGAYLELDPGVSEAMGYTFAGLEHPPVTPQGVPGIHLTLEAAEAGSLGPGAPVTYKGIEVGKIESLAFDSGRRLVTFGVFIHAPYDEFVTANTRFWNASGISAQVGATGISLDTGSLHSLLVGGVSFDVPRGMRPGPPAEDGGVYALYENYRKISEVNLDLRLTSLLLFKESVRGLVEGTPVEYRGLQIGTVADVSLDLLPPESSVAGQIPVLILLDPDVFAKATAIRAGTDREMLAGAVRNGLRASLKTGNLLTGQLFVDLDFYKDAEPAELVTIAEYDLLPTRASGIALMGEKLARILEKIETLPLEETVTTANETIAELGEAAKSIQGAIKNLDGVIGSEASQRLPEDISASLAELRETLEGFGDESALFGELSRTLEELQTAIRSVDSLAGSIERKPNSIIFGRPSGKVAPPRAKE